MKTITIDGRAIVDKASFHEVFASALGFPSWYGRNMDAWIDCMTALDVPNDELSQVKVSSGEVIVLEVEGAGELKSRCPDIWIDLLECSAFVNWRRTQAGEQAVLAISAYA